MKQSKSVRSKRIISRPLEILLRLFGIWPGASCNLFFKIFWLLVIVVVGTYQYLYLVTHFNSIDPTILMYAVSATMALTSRLIKITIFWLHQRKFNDMWRTMTTTWQRANDRNNTDKTYLSHYVPNLIVAFNSFSVVMTTYSTVMSGIHYDEASNATQPYVMMMDLPFDSSKKSVYLSILLGQFFYTFSISTVAATLNSVLIILMLYLCDQMDVICRYLTEMSPVKNDSGAGVTTVKEIVRMHQRVIAFSEDIESLYTYIALVILVFNTIISCGLGFILVTAMSMPNGTSLITKNLLFYCAINIENFVFCFAGEYISSKSREICKAAYSSPWYQSKFHSHIILFLIMRSQNELTITMGKFMDLSLERFANILKVSVSYISVLLAIY